MKIGRRTLLKGAAAAGTAAAAGRAGARVRRTASPDAVGMLYDSTRCIGCRTCVTRCKEANGLPPDRVTIGGGQYDAPSDLSGTTKTIVKLHTGSRSAFVKAQCMHCVDPACTSVCMLGALHKGAGGVVVYDKDLCVGCRYCQVACPFNVPKFEWSSVAPLIVKCEMCRHRADPGKKGPLAIANPACTEACPRQAVIYGMRADLLAEARRRMAAEPARYEPKVYGERDGGGTQMLYLSALGVPFGKLGLPDLGPDPVPELSEKVQHGIYYGFIAPVALFAAVGAIVLRNQKKNEGGA